MAIENKYSSHWTLMCTHSENEPFFMPQQQLPVEAQVPEGWGNRKNLTSVLEVFFNPFKSI